MELTTFAKRMRQAREAKGLKQNELAKLVGVTPVTISSYEKSDTDGNGKKPTLENALSIAKHLDVSLDWLSGLSDTARKSIAEFNAEDYFKSILTILLETSAMHYSDGSDRLPDFGKEWTDNAFNALIIDYGVVNTFIQKANTLIKIYRDGTLTRDMFELCTKKLLSDFTSEYSIVFDCLLDNEEAESEELNYYEDEELQKLARQAQRSTHSGRAITLIYKK